MMIIEVVSQETCPRCQGGEEYHNRPKVADADGWWWRCYNDACSLRYWNPDTLGQQDEDYRTPEEQTAWEARIAEKVAAAYARGVEVHTYQAGADGSVEHTMEVVVIKPEDDQHNYNGVYDE